MAIRKGGIAHLGAISVAWTGNPIYMNTMNGIYYDGLPIGKAFANGFSYNRYDYQTTMIGDPTIELQPEYYLNEELSQY